MYIGKRREEVGHNEYNSISDGPLAGKGFVRLVSRKDIEDIYFPFKITSVDRLTCTRDNGKITVDEWIIVGGKSV